MQVTADRHTTPNTLRTLIGRETGIDPEEIWFTHHAKPFKDGQTLSDTNVENGDTIHVNLRTMAGARPKARAASCDQTQPQKPLSHKSTNYIVSNTAHFIIIQGDDAETNKLKQEIAQLQFTIEKLSAQQTASINQHQSYSQFPTMIGEPTPEAEHFENQRQKSRLKELCNSIIESFKPANPIDTDIDQDAALITAEQALSQVNEELTTQAIVEIKRNLKNATLSSSLQRQLAIEEHYLKLEDTMMATIAAFEKFTLDLEARCESIENRI